jgi:hypothetical protein
MRLRKRRSCSSRNQAYSVGGGEIGGEVQSMMRLGNDRSLTRIGEVVKY